MMTVRNQVIGIVMGLVMTGSLWGASREWTMVQSAMEKKGPSAAIPLLERAVQSDPTNADLAYDLGTAYLMADRVGPAIWYLETAVMVSPRDLNIRKNLLAANQRIRHIPTTTPIWDVVVGGLRWVTAVEAAWGWILMTSILSIMAILWGFRRISTAELRLGIVVWAILTIPTGIRIWDAMSPRGVVMGPRMALRVMPQGDASTIADVPEGTVGRLTEFKGGWVRIQLPDGMIGWGPLDDIRPL